MLVNQNVKMIALITKVDEDDKVTPAVEEKVSFSPNIFRIGRIIYDADVSSFAMIEHKVASQTQEEDLEPYVKYGIGIGRTSPDTDLHCDDINTGRNLVFHYNLQTWSSCRDENRCQSDNA